MFVVVSLDRALFRLHRLILSRTGVTKVKEEVKNIGIPFFAINRNISAFRFVAKRVMPGPSLAKTGISISVLKVINSTRVFRRTLRG